MKKTFLMAGMFTFLVTLGALFSTAHADIPPMGPGGPIGMGVAPFSMPTPPPMGAMPYGAPSPYGPPQPPAMPYMPYAPAGYPPLQGGDQFNRRN